MSEQDTKIEKIHMENNKVEIDVSGLWVTKIAAETAAFLKKHKVKNFMTFDMIDDTDPNDPIPMSVVISYKYGKSTMEKIKILREGLEKIINENPDKDACISIANETIEKYNSQ